MDLDRRLYTRWDQEELDPRSSPHFVHQPQNIDDAGSIWFEAAIDGDILFQSDRSLSDTIRTIRHSALSGRLLGKTAYGHPY